MSAALQYLGGMPVYWISLARAEERRAQWYHATDFVFGHSTRVEAVDARDLSDAQVEAHLRATIEAFTTDPNLVPFRYPPPSMTSARSRYTARVNAAVRLSHLRALEAGIKSGFPRFLVAEDDLVPRTALWNEDVPVSPLASQLSVWSGALRRFTIADDEAAWRAGQPLRWAPIVGTQVFCAFGAELYEVTRDAAIFMVDTISRHDLAWDHAWGFAMRDLETWRLKPRAFAQIGKSYRNHKTRKQTITRGTK